MARTYTREEVEGLLQALNRQGEAMALSIKAQKGAAWDGFGTCRLFRDFLPTANMKFFSALSTSTVLLLGARGIFISELRSLHEVHETLRGPGDESRLDEAILNELGTAEYVLEEIVQRVLGFLMFGGGRA